MRRIIEAYAGEDGLHCTLTGVFPNSVEDTPGTHRHFNTLSPAQRVATARRELASAGVAGLPPLADCRADRWGRTIALDAETVKPVRRSRDGLFGHVVGPSEITEGPAKDSASRAGRLHRALDRVLDCMERKQRRRAGDRRDENRVAADSRATRERMSRRDQQTYIDARDTRAYGERAMGTQAVNDEFRRLAGLDAADDGGDAAYFARAAAATCGWGA